METELELSDVLALLNDTPTERPQQKGPLRWFDKPMRCVSRGCSSETFCKVDGIEYCMKHALTKLNEMLVVNDN